MRKSDSPRRSRIKYRSLSPSREILVIFEDGPSIVPVEKISEELIGCKAYGLISLPLEWVPPFFVISESCFDGNCSDDEINEWGRECFAKMAIQTGDSVMVRSSGVSETLVNRGSLLSKHCSPNNLASNIREMMGQLSDVDKSRTKIHWIVQEHVKQRRIGHLSNERRLRRENRDWSIEFDLQDDINGHTESIAVRFWRDGSDMTQLDMGCTSEIGISLQLRKVAKWATQFKTRTHFEWVWDGKRIHIVQVDEEGDASIGNDPSKLICLNIAEHACESLRVFRKANDSDFDKYKKLQNARMYKELGYKMPDFFVLDDPNTIKRLISGEISDGFEDDIIELTRAPLIIRTDIPEMSTDLTEMLPRSEELRSSSQAQEWLSNELTKRIGENNLQEKSICLIAHHFIPSVASAWARAVPGERIVRIESLWGIPEGLYWFSHDTYEVDTREISIQASRNPDSYFITERLRYKGTYIGSDSEGNWRPFKTKPPYDWTRSIRKKKWLHEIAVATRKISEREMQPVSVMWFVGNKAEATAHEVLPWYHSKSELSEKPKAAPRHKRKSARDYSLKCLNDWDKLNSDLKSGKHIERVVVELEEVGLIRNRAFAEELAKLAIKYDFVIQLAGGILSHAFYVLQRAGAKVECIDLFGVDEDVIEFNKIVRDRIPEIIESHGEHAKTIQLAGDALVSALRQKLVEEAFEALDAKSGSDLVGELADIQEVMRALCESLQIDYCEVEKEREDKNKKRGSFTKGLMLVKTAAPHSIKNNASEDQTLALELNKVDVKEVIIAREDGMPVKPQYRRPDLRYVDDQLEKMLTFETEINRGVEFKGDLNVSLPIDDKMEELTLRIELTRVRSSLRGVVRLGVKIPQQLEFKF